MYKKVLFYIIYLVFEGNYYKALTQTIALI